MARSDRIISLILIILSALAIYLSGSFPSLEVSETGPALFPIIVSWAIILLSLLLFIKSYFISDEKPVSYKNFRKIILTVGVMIFYLIGFIYVGFFVSSVISLIAIMYIMDVKNLKIGILVSVISALVIYLVFSYVFNVPLPEVIFF